MACPPLLRGVVMRATRLDACGRPVYGDCNQVVTDGFITVSMSAETEEGEAISVTKANGQTCINEPGCEQLSGYTLEMEFCAVDPDLVQIMNPSFEIYRDYDGNPIGWDESVELKCDTGYALELWTNVYASGDACSGAGSQGEWGYLLLPWVVGGAPGDLEIGNDAVSFTFNGRTKVGAGWRRGPYNVQAGAGGIPVPLLKPVGPKTPRRFFKTTIRPPEPECGCQPVDRPTPDPADLYITGIGNESPRKTIRFRADNHGFGPLMVDFGDGTPPQEVADGAWVTHVYDTDGTYTIKACDKQTPVVCSSRDVTVPLPADEPTLVLSAENADDPYEVTATVGLPSQSDGTAIIDWGDGTAPREIAVGSNGTVADIHKYSVPSVYTVTVRRGDIDTYRTRAAIVVPAVPEQTPEVTAAPDSADTTGRTAAITLVGFPADGTVNVNWGDGSAAQTLPARTTTATHAYAAGVEGAQTITATSATDATKTASATFTPAPPVTVPAATATPDAADPMTAALAWTGFPAATTSVSVTWGDGSAAQTGLAATGGAGTATHTYAAGTEGTEQTITVTSEQDTTQTTTATFTPTAPAPAPAVTAVADAGDATGHTATLTLTGFPAGSAVSVNWGDGSAAEEIAAGTTTGSHVYAAGVTTEQTITATSVGDASKTASTTFTPGGAGRRAAARKK
ncbi:hypothetical protein AB0D98_11070 [Streptomyces sp. NPDC047987]|uniref:hypothetical protein n=1 Tax=unclassified Streptomyces TaxID=2593676 RepID=UPI0034314468